MIDVRRTSLFLILAGLIVSVGLGNSPAQDKTKQKTDPKAKVDPKADTKADPKAKAEQSKAAATGLTFEVYKDAGDKFRWRIKDSSGANLGMAPRGYDTKEECQKHIDAIKAGAAQAKVTDGQ